MELAGYLMGGLVRNKEEDKKVASTNDQRRTGGSTRFKGKGGCLAFMSYVTEEVKPKEIKDVPIVSDFADVFPDELPGIPTDRDVEFMIDLIPGTAPIAKALYRLAPTELKELKKQLDELRKKGFIRPSLSP
ncbi:uncharacterized protein LOC143597700 [Bidens hawaiensis]|uniref:uncharacterized protein LOC143597700 n=1 Tax=Bidens hawaiensis TaxID=980011 RepID=UPI00404B2421